MLPRDFPFLRATKIAANSAASCMCAAHWHALERKKKEIGFMDYIGFWRLFRDFTYDIAFLHVWRGEAQGT